MERRLTKGQKELLDQIPYDDWVMLPRGYNWDVSSIPRKLFDRGHIERKKALRQRPGSRGRGWVFLVKRIRK